MVGAAAAPQRRGDTGRNPAQERECEGAEPERDAHRQALADELGDGEIPLAQRDAEVPARECAKILQVLRGQRLIESVETLQVGAHRRCETLFLVERAARCQTQDEEGDGDDSEESRDESGNAPEHVVQHGGAL